LKQVAKDNDLWDVEEQLAFYGAYHHTPGNKAIHLVFVPIILWTAMILLGHVRMPFVKPFLFAPGLAFQPSLATLVIGAFEIYYILLDPVAGLLYLPIALLMTFTASYLVNFPPSWMPFLSLGFGAGPAAWSLFVLAWVAQFLGHGLIEKRQPALFDNLVQSTVLANYFVFFELLFSVFNYRPDVQKRVHDKVVARVGKMNHAKAK